MSDLMVGLELLLTGLAVVFMVLLFLMYLMKLLAVVAGPKQEKVQTLPKPPVIVKEELQDDELIAVMAALSGLLPKNKQAVVRFKARGSAGSADDEPEIAALIGALNCVLDNSTNQKIVSVKPLA